MELVIVENLLHIMQQDERITTFVVDMDEKRISCGGTTAPDPSKITQQQHV